MHLSVPTSSFYAKDYRQNCEFQGNGHFDSPFKEQPMAVKTVEKEEVSQGPSGASFSVSDPQPGNQVLEFEVLESSCLALMNRPSDLDDSFVTEFLNDVFDEPSVSLSHSDLLEGTSPASPASQVSEWDLSSFYEDSNPEEVPPLRDKSNRIEVCNFRLEA